MMMDYTEHTPLVVAGRPPSFEERTYWQGLHDGLRRAAVWLMAALSCFFAYHAWWMVPRMPFFDGLLTAVLLTPATLMGIFYPFYDKHVRENALKTAWYTEQADKARLAAGNTVTLWDDRVVWTDLRGETTLWFSCVTLCTESVHGFCLQADTANLLIRAADLTAEQVIAVRQRLQTALPRECYRTKSAAIGCLHVALPLPVFENDDEVLSRTAVDVALPRTATLREKRIRMGHRLLVPAGIIFGVIFAGTLSVLPLYWMNLLFFCVTVTAAVNALLALLVTQKKRRKTTVYAAFTRDGVALFSNGQQFFFVWERVKVRENARYRWLIFPDGDRLRLPRKSHLKGDSYHG